MANQLLIEDGCYLVRYVPVESFPDVLFFDGTARFMRIKPDVNPDNHDTGVIKGGADLYYQPGCTCDPELSAQRRKELRKFDPALQKQTKPDDDGTSIPIFPRDRYRYYLELTNIIENIPEQNVSLSVSIHEFKEDTEWPNPGSRWVCLRKVAPPNYREFFVGSVLDQDSGQITGTLTMCKISNVLRRATVVIHRVKGVKFFPGYSQIYNETITITPENFSPKKKSEDKVLQNQAEGSWRAAFQEAGWDVALELNEPDLKASDSEGIWQTGELQQALYLINLRRRLGPKVKEIEKKAGKTLEELTRTEIQDYLPDLSEFPDPLDEKWIYQLLCVKGIEGLDRGVMFDPYGSDSDNLPREGAAIAAEWLFGDVDGKPRETPNTDEEKLKNLEIDLQWGDAANKQLQNVPAVYFRVGVHEIGHALGLDHNFKDDGFMNTTDSIAKDSAEKLDKYNQAQTNLLEVLHLPKLPRPLPQPSIAKSPFETLVQDANVAVGSQVLPRLQTAEFLKKVGNFPALVVKHFQADDLDRLRFGPDVTVRPGTRYNNSGPLAANENAGPADGLELQAFPLLRAIPLGAPARINLRIVNTSGLPQQAPASLSLKSGVISGSVVDPKGNERNFWPLKKNEDSDPGGILPPYETNTYTMTLLRGPQKALFPMAGDHLVKVRATWQRDGKPVLLEARTIVHVHAPVDDDHLATALRILATPDTLHSIAIIGQHLIEGNDAIKAAVDNPTLRPHYAVIRAKLLLTKPTDIKQAYELIKGHAVMSFDEIASFAEMMKSACNKEKSLDKNQLEEIIKILLSKIEYLRATQCIESRRTKKVIALLKNLA